MHDVQRESGFVSPQRAIVEVTDHPEQAADKDQEYRENAQNPLAPKHAQRVCKRSAPGGATHRFGNIQHALSVRQWSRGTTVVRLGRATGRNSVRVGRKPPQLSQQSEIPAPGGIVG